MKKFNIAVVGATGMVGRKFLQVLEERNLPVDNYYLFASSRSAGKELDFMGKKYTVIELTEANVMALKGKVDFALFSAGGSTSKEFAPVFVKAEAIVVDNSSQWRMYDDVPLVVPEVNPEDVDWNHGIIANPNCSTIQAMLPLKALNDAFGIKRVVYSTYQAVSGAGMQGYNDLKDGIEKGAAPVKIPRPIAYNVVPHIDVFLPDGYTKEEWKMIHETRKILHAPDMRVTATTVRVPVFYGHSESINVEFNKPCTLEAVMSCLKGFGNNLIVTEDPATYPTALDAEDHDEVYVGRIRLDDSVESGINFWCVADNIRKGAATNAVQIVELLIKKAEA